VSSKPASKKVPSKRAPSSRPAGAAAKPAEAGMLEALSEAIESGAGLPEVARAAARVLDASVALIDRSSAVLAVAAPSSGEETRLLEAGAGVIVTELRVADAVAGELRYRPHSEPPPGMVARMVATLLGLEVERARAPEWASDEAAGELVRAILDRKVTDRGDIVARAAELGAAVEKGAGVVIARATPHAAQSGDWRARVLTVSLRALRAAASGTLAALGDGDAAEVIAIVPATEGAVLERAGNAVQRELEASLGGFAVSVARSRWAQDPVDLYRAGKEATLAANVGEAEGVALLAFEDTGSYRLLLPAMSEDEGELERFYGETVAPLAAYDEQYETDLVNTVEAFLENDGNVTPTADQLFTHRHTIRYRLERVRELSGHDISSTEGREKLSLGLKSMRVLGIAPPRGPAAEPGTEAGKVRQVRNEEL
jgi:sugar diacid utilization regulator